MLRFGQWAKHLIVDHRVVFAIVEMHALGIGLVAKPAAVKIENVARADEQRDRSD